MTNNLTENLNRFKAFWRHFSGAEAINNILVVCVILYVWNFVSGVIDNPARYLPAPDVVIFSSFDLFHKGLLPVYFGLGHSVWVGFRTEQDGFRYFLSDLELLSVGLRDRDFPDYCYLVGK
jgi:hypothetical protein